MTSVDVLPDVPFTVTDARSLGISDRWLRDAVRNKHVRRVIRGVYVAAGVEDTVELRSRAAALVVSPHSVVCDRTAAWLHEVDVFGIRDLAIIPPVETCVFRGCAPSDRSGVDGRTRDLRSDDVMSMFGLTVTTPLRTALDLGCALPRHRALGALDGFMRVHGVTHEQMMQQLPRYFRRRGVIQLRALICLADGRAESPRESWVRLDILDNGLPLPELQHWIVIEGVPTYRLDLAYPKHRVAVEYDGEDFHRRTQEQKEYDSKRRTWLREHGWIVIVIDKDGINAPNPVAWIDDLREALRSRTKRLRWTRTPY